MSLLPFCEWLAGTPGSIALHESLYMYPLVESAHVLTLCLFVGMAVMLDLRLLGVTLRSVPVAQLDAPAAAVDARRLPHHGHQRRAAVLRDSGPLVPEHLLPGEGDLLMLAGLNALVFHRASTGGSRVGQRRCRRARRALRRHASLVLWAVIIVAGRMIAYNWFDCDKHRSRGRQCAGRLLVHAERPADDGLLPFFQWSEDSASARRSASRRGRLP